MASLSIRSVVSAALLGAVGLTLAQWSVRPGGRPNVVLITVDTLRPDRLSSYGYEKHRTPNFDRLAQEGVLFENAFCDVTWTTPSMASVMTGRYSPTHGLRSSVQRLSNGAITLAELLSAQGVKTAAIVASYPLDSIFGLDQGFKLYDDSFTLPVEPEIMNGTPASEKARVAHAAKLELRRQTESQRQTGMFMVMKARHDAYRPDNELSDRAIRWLRNERVEPFFLWLHYFGPHEKPQPSSFDRNEWLKRWREDYDPDVIKSDEQVGRVLDTLDALGLSHRTAVILHADHGQSLTEHQYFGHGLNVFDPTQRVPLLMRMPGRLPADQKVRRLVRNVDIFPTILDLLEIPLTVPIDGRILHPTEAGSADGGADDETYVETYLPATLLFGEIRDAQGNVQLGYRRIGVRTPRWKFIINDPIPLSDADDSPEITDDVRRRYYHEELYDLQSDPGETVNVIAAHPDLAGSFLQTVWRYQGLSSPQSETVQLDDASRERLRALGYIQ